LRPGYDLLVLGFCGGSAGVGMGKEIVVDGWMVPFVFFVCLYDGWVEYSLGLRDDRMIDQVWFIISSMRISGGKDLMQTKRH